MSELTLIAESGWTSPWVLHAMVALEEKRLGYEVQVIDLPRSAERKAELDRKAVIGKVPILIHSDVWISESLAISEYLAETFPTPAHPRLFPADLAWRARARQVMSYVRTDLHAVVAERPTTTIFGPPIGTPLSPDARRQADELLRAAHQLIQPDRSSICPEFCIADVDLATALKRLIHGEIAVPEHLVRYAEGVWSRPSVQKFLRHRAP